MASNQYIEINSTYRNRNLWQKSAEFEIPMEQSGLLSKDTAYDPVCDAAPLFAWTSNRLDVATASSATISVTPITGTTASVGGLTSNTNVVFDCSVSIQQLANYYAGLVINCSVPPATYLRRIDADQYLGQSSTPSDLMIVSMINPMTDAALTSLSFADIIDPSDFGDLAHPFLFVPNGRNIANTYNQYILYNETLNQYRPILRYSDTTHILELDTSGSATATYTSGPIDGNWSVGDNYSIRKQPPLVPPLGATLGAGTTPFIVETITDTDGDTYTTSTSLIVVRDVGNDMSATADAYKNDFLRILPFGSDYSADDRAYLYTAEPSNNQARRITSYRHVESATTPGDFYAVFQVETPFDTTLANLFDTGSGEGAVIEVLLFSYDNFSPFSYTGSLVSAQECVCYEIQLHSITLPNAQLSVSNGGRLVNYPFIYVELSNVSSTTGASQPLYSNNPNAWSALFRCTIYDINVPLITPFVRIDGSGAVVNVKFKPNDCLYFRVWLPDGTTFETITAEKFMPYEPNYFNQISALFRIRRT